MKKLCFGIITLITLILILAAGCDDTPYVGPGKGADRLPPLTVGPDAAVLRQKSEFELALDEVAAARREVKISSDEGATVTHAILDVTNVTHPGTYPTYSTDTPSPLPAPFNTVTNANNATAGGAVAFATADRKPCYEDEYWTTSGANGALITSIVAIRADSGFKELVGMGMTDRHMPDRFAVPVREAVAEFRSAWKPGTVPR